MNTDSAPPDFLTVEEAAAILRIGRTAAYPLARLYIATNGAAGLPAARYGRKLRVSRFLLEQALGGPITWPIVNHKAAASPVAPMTSPTSRQRTARRRTPRAEQASLPFSA